MPSWNIHLEAGERLADKLKFSGKKRKMFLLGCLLPDINNGYVNKAKIVKPHEETHFAYGEKSSLNFYAEYKEEVDARDPICLGYLFHLYTDGFFNYEFYKAMDLAGRHDGLSTEERLKIKHHDFWIYDMNFQHCLGLNGDAELTHDLAEAASKISVVEVLPEEIAEVEGILVANELNDDLIGQEYTFFTEEKFDWLLDEMIKSFCEKYLEKKNA